MGAEQLPQEPQQRPQEERPSRRRSLRLRCLPRNKLPNEYDLWWYPMPRGRARGRGRGRRRGHSYDRRPCARRVVHKAWTGSEESLVPPADTHLPTVAAPTTVAVTKILPDQPLMLQRQPSDVECSQNSTLLTALCSAVLDCHLQADIGQLLEKERVCFNSAADSEGAKVHFSLDTKSLTPNIRRFSTAGQPGVYRYVPLSPESRSETSAQDFENIESHSIGELESKSSGSSTDANVRSQTMCKGRAQSVGPRNWVTDPQTLETDVVKSSKCMSCKKQDNPLLADHNHNFLSSSTSGSTVEVLQSDNENSMGSSTPSTKHQCFHSTVPSTLCNDTAVNGNSDSTSVYCYREAGSDENEAFCVSWRISEPSSTEWNFAPPLEVPQIGPVSFDRPTKQNVDFITRTGRHSVSMDSKISCQPELILHSRNTNPLLSHSSLSKWRLKPPPKRHLSKLKCVKSANAALKRILKDECSQLSIALEQGFSVFCKRCCHPGRMHPRNQNKVIKKRFHRKYWNNLQILKNNKLSKLSDQNGEIKCCSCHRPLWKCHKNNMLKIREMAPKSLPTFGSNCVVNKTEEITRIEKSETEDKILIWTKKLQNHFSHLSSREFLHIPNTAAEESGSKVFTNLLHLKQNSDLTSKLKFQTLTLIMCMPSEKDNGMIESDRVHVPCETGQEFMATSNKSNPYLCKISGIYGSENGISACLEDQGDLSNEFDFDIKNSGQLTLPSYEAQLVVSKDKADTWNIGENSVFLRVMAKHSSCAEGISHFVLKTVEKTACNSETDPPVDSPQLPLDDVGEQFKSIKNTHHGSNEALSEETSSKREETIGHKNSEIQTKEMDSIHGENYHPDVVLQINGTKGGQLTSIESMHSGNNRALPEVTSSVTNGTVFHKKNYIEDEIAAHNHKIDSPVVMPQTVNMREQLNHTEKTQGEDTDAQLGEISPVLIEMLGHNEGSARGSSYNEKNGQSSTKSVCEKTECGVRIKEEKPVLNEETECVYCVKKENQVLQVGEHSKETLEVVNSDLLQNTDVCPRCGGKINNRKNSPIHLSDSITVKEEKVKVEEEDFEYDGTYCEMCEEDRKQMHRMSATTSIEPAVTKSSSSLVPKDKLLAQSCQNDVSSTGCSSDVNSNINNSSVQAESLLVQSSGSNVISIDLTISDEEELCQQRNSIRSPGKTAEEVSVRNEVRSLSVAEPLTGQQMVSMMMELQELVNSPDFISGNNNCIENKVSERLSSPSNSTVAFNCVPRKQAADEIENQLRNLFSENSSMSDIQMFMEGSTESNLCNIKELLSELNVPYRNDKHAIAHEDGFQLTCDSSSTNESQSCVTKDMESMFTTENTEDTHNAEHEINGDTSAVILHEKNAEYKLCNFQEELGSVNQPIIGHEDSYQQNSDISSTNKSHNCLNMKYESSSDQEHGSCTSYSESDSESDASVQIITEIIHSESSLNNQLDDKSLCTYPLSVISSKEKSEIIGSGCSPMSSMTEMVCSENLLPNQADGRTVTKCPLSSFNTKETCKHVDSDCNSTLDRAKSNLSEDISYNEAEGIQVFKYPQFSLDSQETCDYSDFRCTSTLARTVNKCVDCDSTSTAETMHDLKTTTESPEMEQKGAPVIRVSISLSSITDSGLLESLLSERKRRKAGLSGRPHTQTPERRKLEKSSDVRYSPTSNSKRKAVSRDVIRRMNGRGKRTLEKVSQVNEVDQSPVPDLHSHKGSEKNHENDDARPREVIESSNIAITKHRSAHDDNEEHSANDICKEKKAHQPTAVSQYEEGSEEEGELQICEEPMEEEEEEGEEHNGNSEEDAAVLSHGNLVQEKRLASEQLYESDKIIKRKGIEGSNITAPQKYDDLESSKYSCGNQSAWQERQAVSSVPDRHEAQCKRKLLTDDTDESQMIIHSNVAQSESLPPPQKLPQIKQPSSPLQNVGQHFSRNNLSTETSGPIVSDDGDLSDVKASMDFKFCNSSDTQVSLKGEKNALNFDEGSNKLPSEHRIGAEDTATPFKKISRKTINERDVHEKKSKEQETGDSKSSVCMNKVLKCSSSKSSTRRISSKARMKYIDIESLPPSYQILRRDLNEVLEQEKLCEVSYSSPRKVPKKLSVPKVGGYRRPRVCQKIQIINDTEESMSKKIRREGPDCADSAVSAEDQEKSCVKKETEHIADLDSHTTKNRCQLDANVTALGNCDVHQHQKKKKTAVAHSEEMKVCHKPTLPEQESAVSPVDQINMATKERKKCTVRLKRCDGFSWIQCENESTVVESGDISTEKSPVFDECGETDRVPEENVAAEHTPFPEIDDHGDTSSVLSKHSETEVENSTTVAKEQMDGHPEQLLTRRNSSQKIQEADHKSLACTGRKDAVNKSSVEETVHQNHSSSVEVTDEAISSHDHKLAVEASHSQHKKLPSPVQNKKSNVCAAEQSHQFLSPCQDEYTAPESNINNPNQATPHSFPVNHQSRQEDFAMEIRGNRQQYYSVNCGIDEGDETNRSSYRIAAPESDDQVPQNFVERRSESPHFENIDSQQQETRVVFWEKKVQERMAELLSLMQKGKSLEIVDLKKQYYETVEIVTRALGEIEESENKTQTSLQGGKQTEQHLSTSEAPCGNTTEQSVPEQLSLEPETQPPLQDRKETEQHVSTSEAPCDYTTEQSAPEQLSHKPKAEFQQPVSESDETNEQHIAQKPLQKSGTDFQDPAEKLHVSECDETNKQDSTQMPLEKSGTDFQVPVERLPKSTICEADSQDEALIQRKPSTQEVGRSQTENYTVPLAQHTERSDIGPQTCTSQSHQTVTSNQFLSQESLSSSEHLKQYSEQTPADEEETIRQQKTDQQCAMQHSVKERQPLQGKDVEPHNSQAQMLSQQPVKDQHRAMLNTIKQQKQFSIMQQITQEKEAKCHKELQQSSLQQSVIQTRAAVQQWNQTQQRSSHHHQTHCMDMDKVVSQQQNVSSSPTQAERAASIVQNPLGRRQALLRQQQQLQHLASLEQQPMRQLPAIPNPVEQPQPSMQQQTEWQQQRAAHHIPRQYSTVEHQAVTQNQQQPHPYHRFYFPQVQQPYQVPHSTEVQLRPNYPHQFHSRLTFPQTWNSNSHLLRQMPCGPLDGRQLQIQQQKYSHFQHQQQLDNWHSSRRPGMDEAATVPAVLASPSMSGGAIVESEHDRRRILSSEAINSFDTGHRIGAVPSSSCPVTPANTETIHTAQVHPSQVHPSQAYLRAAPPQPQPNNSTAPVQAPLNTGSIHQRSTRVLPPSTVDQEQPPTDQEGRLWVPTPPRVSAFVERVMKNYQPDVLDTEDTYRHPYKLPERELAARFEFPQHSLYTRHGTSIQQLPYSQPVMMFPGSTRIPATPTQPLLSRAVHSAGQSLHQVYVPPPASSFESVNNSPVNVPVNCVQPAPIGTNMNVHHLHTELATNSSSQISQGASLSSVRDSENLNCECNVIDLSRDRNTPEDNGRCHIVSCSERAPRGTELHHTATQKTHRTCSSKTIEVPQPSDCIQDNVPDNLQLNSSTTKAVHHSVSLGEKRKSETSCGTPEKRLCQDTDNEACAVSNTGTHQVTAMDLSPSTVADCTAKSTPSQSSPHVLGASYPQLCATSRLALDSKQPAMSGKGANYVNCGQQNRELCPVNCCEESRCSTRLAAAGSTCCGATQQSQHSPSDER